VTSGFGGSQWTVAPVYSLDDSEVKIVVFTPHSKIEMPSVLPTPPPSPPMPQIMMQPMHIPTDVEEEAATEAEEKQAVVPLPRPVRISHNLGIIRRMFTFYTGMIWWILGMLFKRIAPLKPPAPKPVTSLKIKSNSSSVAGSGASTPLGARSSSMTTTTSGTATPTTPGGFVSGKEVFTSPTIRKNPEETSGEWHFEDAKEVKEKPQALTLDIPATPTIKLYIRGLETQKEIEALRFGLNGKEVKPSIAAVEGGWLIQLVSEASGRFTIRI